MSVAKIKNRVSSSTPRRNFSKLKNTAEGLNDEQIVELLAAYQTMGKMLEKLIGRERLYRPQFLAGLKNALQDVATGRTKEVKSFEDFAG